MNDCPIDFKRFYKFKQKINTVNTNLGGNRYANIHNTNIPMKCDYQENKTQAII